MKRRPVINGVTGARITDTRVMKVLSKASLGFKSPFWATTTYVHGLIGTNSRMRDLKETFVPDVKKRYFNFSQFPPDDEIKLLQHIPRNAISGHPFGSSYNGQTGEDLVREMREKNYRSPWWISAADLNYFGTLNTKLKPDQAGTSVLSWTYSAPEKMTRIRFYNYDQLLPNSQQFLETHPRCGYAGGWITTGVDILRDVADQNGYQSPYWLTENDIRNSISSFGKLLVLKNGEKFTAERVRAVTNGPPLYNADQLVNPEVVIRHVLNLID